MRTLFVGATALAALCLPANALSTKEFLDTCHGREDWQQVACMSYAAGVVDAYQALAMTAMTPTNPRASASGICVGMNVPIGARDMVRYAESFMSEWREAAASVPAATSALAGLRKAYPCSK